MDGVLNMKVPHFLSCYRTVTGCRQNFWKGTQEGRMKTVKIANFLFCLLLIIETSCSFQERTRPTIRLELVADGFTSPVALIDASDGSHRLFAVDQTGLIWILLNGKRIKRPFFDLRDRAVNLNSFNDDRGLLGLPFHPAFARNVIFTFLIALPFEGVYHRRNGTIPPT